MNNPAIDIRLVGSDEDGGHVQLNDFRHFCGTVTTCLRRVEEAVTQRSGRIRYLIGSLRDGSAVMRLEAIRPKSGRDDRAEVVATFTGTVIALQRGRPVDPRLPPAALEAFRELYAGLRNVKQVWIGGAEITTRYVANIDEILRPAITSEGSVTGTLERLNVHNKNEFVLYPPLRTPVTCVFPDELFEQVRAAVKRKVTVSGALSYPSDKPYPVKVQVKSLEVHPPDEELPTLGSLRGLFRGCTGDKTATDFVRTIRDEQD